MPREMWFKADDLSRKSESWCRETSADLILGLSHRSTYITTLMRANVTLVDTELINSALGELAKVTPGVTSTAELIDDGFSRVLAVTIRWDNAKNVPLHWWFSTAAQRIVAGSTIVGKMQSLHDIFKLSNGESESQWTSGSTKTSTTRALEALLDGRFTPDDFIKHNGVIFGPAQAYWKMS